MLKNLSRNKRNFVVFIIIFAAAGAALLIITKASTPSLSLEPENGSPSPDNCAKAVPDSGASNQSAIQFGGSGTSCVAGTPKYGAQLPITYNLASLTGTVRYVATNGSDGAAGTVSAPYATLSKAYSAAAAGDSIVVRGGTYRQGNLTISASKPVKIIAYPGETPVFNGAQTASSWTSDGSLKYTAYTPQPVTDGSGISFTTGQNLTGDFVGKFPDQAWVGNAQLQQVTAKTSVMDGKFWVDSANGRLYVTANNANQGNLEVSQKDVFMSVNAPNTTLEGLKITRFSNSANDYGVIKYQGTADSAVMRNVEISDSAFLAVTMAGDSNLNTGSLMKNVTVTSSNWMGIVATYTDNFTMDSVKITNMNKFNEFTFSPQSGAVKTGRTRKTKVINSEVSDNNSHGLWFDQSNIGVEVADSQIVNNTGSSVFFEISDDLLLVNNYIKAAPGASGQAVKLAGSSGLKLVNNTIIGGTDALGIYTDSRSKPGCADTSQALCTSSYNSDRDSVRTRPATLDWIPRLDLMINNIVAYPSAVKYCSTAVALCITNANSGATVPMDTIIHKADSLRPQTVMNGNVYANGSGNIINTDAGSKKYTVLSAFTTAMGGSPVNIAGIENLGKFGNAWVNPDGSPTTALSAVHSQAIAIPNDAAINQYIAAGTHHYGVTTK